MRFSTQHLATRVAVIFFLAMAALAVILGASFALIVYQNQQTNTASLEREIAQRAAVTIDEHLDSLRAPLVQTVHLCPGLGSTPPSEQQAVLDDLLAQNSSYLELALLDGQGSVTATVARAGHHLESIPQDPDRSAAFRAALKGQAYLGQVHLTATDQEPYVAIGEPLPRGAGALLAWIDLRHVWDIVSSVQVGSSGYAYLLDGQGNLIAYRDPALVLAHENPTETNAGLRAHLQTPGGVADYTGLDGAPVIGSHAPIASADWVVVVETPLAEAYSVLYRALALIGVLLLVGVAVAALTARYLAMRFLEPVELLREGAALIGAGHLDHKIVIETGDEIEELANDFNRMTQNLLRARTELEDWARELERRVQERTNQIVAQKEQLAVLEERQRVARELHDSITQALFTLTITLESAQAFSIKDPPRVPMLLKRAHEIAKSALGDTRALISDLRPAPVEQQGLVAGLGERLVAISTRVHIPIELQSNGLTALATASEDGLYRIALEAVSNAVNHAHPTRVLVELSRSVNAAVLTVSDNGCGFDPTAEPAGHFGLATMRERARALGGEVMIESSLGKGTIVRAEIPIQVPTGGQA